MAALMIPGLALAACSSSPGTVQHPADIQTTTTSTSSPAVAVANVEAQYSGDLATETAANATYLAAFNSASADISKQNQQMALDNATITSNEFGGGCTISVADPLSYSNCLSSEMQTANNARTDLAAATSQEEQDFSQYASVDSTFASALSTFIGQVIALSWPSQYNDAVNNVVDAARTIRGDLANGSGITAVTSPDTVSQINAQSQTDVGNFNDALNALKAELPQGSLT